MMDDPLIGSVLSERYEILESLGVGGMSVVYKARHLLMERVVAIKVMNANLTTSSQSLARFQQEAKALSSLCHPNIISVFDFGMLPTGLPYLVMDYLSGETLADLLKDKGTLDIQLICTIFMQVCDGLAHAHSKRIIHRDLKPGNIMLVHDDSSDVVVKVLDFGIAKLLTEEGKELQRLTQTGEVFGSPLYMSPEQCMGERLDQRSDVFSLGCVMYESALGMPPFMGEGVLDTMFRRINELPERFKTARPDLNLPDELEWLITRMLAKNPAQRYQSMAEVKKDLVLLSDGKGGRASLQYLAKSMPTKPSKELVFKSRHVFVAAAVLTTLALILVVGIGVLVMVYKTDDSFENPVQLFLWERHCKQSREALGKGDYLAAERLSLLALKEAQSFGKLNKHVFISLKGLATIYGKEGKYIELESISERLMDMRKQLLVQTFGGNDAGLNELIASAVKSVPKEVSPDNKKASEEESEKLIGLARLCIDQGKLAKAKELFTLALKIQEAFNGKNDPTVCWLLHRISMLALNEGNLSEAEASLKQALAISETLAGSDNPYLASGLTDLGKLYAREGDYTKSEECHKRALHTAVRAYGNDHPMVANCLESYAQMLRDNNRQTEAAVYENRARQIRAH